MPNDSDPMSATQHTSASSRLDSQQSSSTTTQAPSSTTSSNSTETIPATNKTKPSKWQAFKSHFQDLHLSRTHKILFGIAAFLTIILVAAGVMAVHTYSVAQQIKAEAEETELIARQAYDQFKAQNLPAVEGSLTKIEDQLVTINSLYSQLSFYQYVPLASRYYEDGTHGLAAADAGLAAARKSIDAIVPYADVLGFTGEDSFQGGTAEDRLKIVLETLQKVTPEIDQISQDLNTVEAELAEINPEHYPEQIRGTAIRPMIIEGQQLSSGAALALKEFRPAIEQLPSIAGGTGERRKYLVLFQNDNELRPTGGFLTAYAIINVEDGKVTPEKSDDIYELDKRFSKRLPIPEALDRYLTTEEYWNLRDMNISPDFKLSMDQFYTHYTEVPGEPENIDGIIAVDTEFLTNLMEILGPVEVPGYGTFSAENDERCDCPQIIYALSEIITKPTPYIREDRKGILGPLMRELLNKAYAAPKQQWPDLFDQGWQAMKGRHLQMYFVDEAHQHAAEVIGAAGRMRPPEDGSDFLAIVNANLGGAKSNLFTNYEAVHTVSAPSNGRIEKTLELTYRNTRPADNCNLEAGELCLNSTLRDWTRFYLPAGSELVSAQGFTEEPQTYEENGFSVIDGFFILEPDSSAKVTVTYTVPYTDQEDYSINIWKQGGIEEYTMLMDVTGGQERLTIDKDTQYQTIF